MLIYNVYIHTYIKLDSFPTMNKTKVWICYMYVGLIILSLSAAIKKKFFSGFPSIYVLHTIQVTDSIKKLKRSERLD